MNLCVKCEFQSEIYIAFGDFDVSQLNKTTKNLGKNCLNKIFDTEVMYNNIKRIFM